MLYILYALFFLSCVVLIGSVLLQPGKTDAGALFTSNVSSTAFAPRGTASVLAKFTIIAAIVFMVSALMISMPALSGNVSVLSGIDEEPAAGATPTPGPEGAPSPVGETQVGSGEQTIVVGPDGSANVVPANSAVPSNSSAPAGNSSNAAAPAQPSAPSNQ